MHYSTVRVPGRAVAALTVVAMLFGVFAAVNAQADIRVKPGRTPRPVYSSEGLYFSFAPGWIDFDGDFAGLESRHKGGGARLMASYGLSQNVSLFLNLEGAGINDVYNDEWAMGFFDLGLKYTITPDPFRKARFYLLGSIGGAVLAEGDDFDNDHEPKYYGGTGRLALGVDFFIGRRAMLFAELGHRGGTFDRVEQNNVERELVEERDFSSTGFHFGLRLGL